MKRSNKKPFPNSFLLLEAKQMSSAFIPVREFHTKTEDKKLNDKEDITPIFYTKKNEEQCHFQVIF